MNYHSVVYPGVDVIKPLIYRWEIFDSDGALIGIYIGKATSPKRRIPRYRGNVKQIQIGGKPLSGAKSFRKIHTALNHAQIAGHQIVLTYLLNAAPVNLGDAEREAIRRYHSCGPYCWQLNS